MAEPTNNEYDPTLREAVREPRPEDESLLKGFTPWQIANLLRVRQATTLGRYSEFTMESRRLVFARWLVERGKLDG
jgi:hypothetical protein